MIRRSPLGTITCREFCDLISEDQKADLLDGVIYVASPEGTEHNELLTWLSFILGPFIAERNLGRLTLNKVAYRLSDHTMPEPDLAFISKQRLECVKRGYVDGPPDLAIEIVSPDSIERDYENKRDRFEEGGVLEYWIIDPLEQKATFLVREGESFMEEQRRNHICGSKVLEGFELDVRWLWQRPLPRTLAIVQRLLGS